MPSAMAVAVWKAVKKPAITCQGLGGRVRVRVRSGWKAVKKLAITY